MIKPTTVFFHERCPTAHRTREEAEKCMVKQAKYEKQFHDDAVARREFAREHRFREAECCLHCVHCVEHCRCRKSKRSKANKKPVVGVDAWMTCDLFKRREGKA